MKWTPKGAFSIFVALWGYNSKPPSKASNRDIWEAKETKEMLVLALSKGQHPPKINNDNSCLELQRPRD